jgi:hypothetical protein
MNILNIANPRSVSPASQQSVKSVFEFSLSVIDREGDLQKLTAAFRSFPSDRDWSNWLSGWSSCGYSLVSQPVLIKAI